MSLGPEIKEEIVEIKPIVRARMVARKVIAETVETAKQSIAVFFIDPLYNLFFVGLALVMIGLLFGATFSRILYFILVCLGTSLALRPYLKQKYGRTG